MNIFVAGAPPSYNQLFGVAQMKEDVNNAREESANKGVFAVKLVSILCGSGETVIFLKTLWFIFIFVHVNNVLYVLVAT